jgi:hypothetical protein
MLNRRRSKRLPLNIPVRIYGRTVEDLPFREETVTKAVSADGGLMAAAAPVSEGQRLRIVNRITDEERECLVVYVERKTRGKGKVGVRFLNRDGDFWHVYSPTVVLNGREKDEPQPSARQTP